MTKYFAVTFDTMIQNGVSSSIAKLYTDYWETTCERVSSERGWSVIEELKFKPLNRGNYTCWRNPNVTLESLNKK